MKFTEIRTFTTDGDLNSVYVEPLNLDAINVVLEEVFEELEVGEYIKMTLLEGTKEDFEYLQEQEGY